MAQDHITTLGIVNLAKLIADHEKNNPISKEQQLEDLLLKIPPKVYGAGSGNVGDLLYDDYSNKVHCYITTPTNPDGEWVEIAPP